MTMQHLEKALLTKRNLALLITLIVGCLTCGAEDHVSFSCKFMTPFSFNILSMKKIASCDWFCSNFNFLWTSKVDACSPFPME